MTSPVAPTETDIDVVQGATFKMRATWKDDQATPQPISLSAYKAHMQIRTKQGGGVLIADASSEGLNPELILEAEGTGQIDVRLPPLQTVNLKKATYHYDLFVIKKDDPTFAVRLVWGLVNVSLSVTDSTETSSP